MAWALLTLGQKSVGQQPHPLNMVTGRDLEDSRLVTSLSCELDALLIMGWKTHLVITSCGAHFLLPWIT